MDAFDKVKNYDIEEVSIKLLLPFKFSEQLSEVISRIEQLTLAELARSHLSLLHTNNSPYDYSSLWQQVQYDDSNLSGDLYPHVARLLNTQDTDVALSNSYQISQGAVKLLSNFADENETNCALNLILSNEARNRFNQPTETEPSPLALIPWRLGSQSIRLNLYNLGIGVFEIDALPCEGFIKHYGFNGLQEFINAITRVKLKSSDHRLGAMTYRLQGEGEPDNSFELFNLIGSCIGIIPESSANQDFKSSLGNFKPLSLNRHFSYTAIRLNKSIQLSDDKKLSEADAICLAKCLAHRQTKDHRTTRLVDNNKNAFTPFENITHYSCIEGGSVVLNSDSTDDIIFVSNFINSKLKTVYWPLTLIAYIEFIYLFKLNGDVSPSISFDEGNIDTIKILKTYREQILQFRLQYRFAQASHLQLHNIYYNNWRLTFENEKLMEELVEDLNQVNSFLSYDMETIEVEIEKKHNKNITTLGILATGMLSLLSLWGTNFSYFQDLNITDSATAWTAVIGIVITFGAMYIYYNLDKIFHQP